MRLLKTKMGFQPTFSSHIILFSAEFRRDLREAPEHQRSARKPGTRHAKTDASIALVIWLNENVGFQPTFSSHIIYFQRSSGEQSSELAMPKLMQASLWSFGLTKTLTFYCFSSGHPSAWTMAADTMVKRILFFISSGAFPI